MNQRGPEVVVVPTPGLGNSTYLVGAGAEAVVIDVPRDAWRLAGIAQDHGWRITQALETHVHNDYLSGARQLESAHGTRIVAPGRGGYAFGHVPADEGYEVDVAGGGLVARATPGHTPEHLSWELQDAAGMPTALFSGGSLLIGGVGRTDLLGRARIFEMTRAQFDTMRRLAELPDDVIVYPTHGAGSFCVAGDVDIGGLATIGTLKRWNPAFAADDLEAFDAELTAGRTLYPAYYGRMAPLNRRGPRHLMPPEPNAMTTERFIEARAAGSWVLDTQPARDSGRAQRLRAGGLTLEL